MPSGVWIGDDPWPVDRSTAGPGAPAGSGPRVLVKISRMLEWFRGRAPIPGPEPPPDRRGPPDVVPGLLPLTFPDSPAPPVSTESPGGGIFQESAFMSQATTEAKPVVSKNQAIGWLRQMLLIRRFEEQSYKLYQMGGKIGGFCHLYSGQEPVAVGSIGVLREDDFVITAYRDHGHALARGMGGQRGDGRDAGQATPAARRARAARCTSSTPRRASSAATPSSAATSRSPPAWPSPASTRARTRSASATSATAP